LDEGVDVPRTQYGIFASSTGNPRQYIQRRGRLLRKHEDKDHAYIYDMIVIPNSVLLDEKPDYYEIEKKLVKSELSRVAYFAQLASNYYSEVQPVLKDVINFYELDIAEMILSITQ
jgi:superfamily II DNA or RNA helicase